MFCFCPLCQILIDHKDLDIFLGSLFCSIGPCVCSYVSTRLFWLQWPCNTVWYQVLWSLLLCSSFSELLQLFRVIYGSIYISEMFVLYLWNMSVNFIWRLNVFAHFMMGHLHATAHNMLNVQQFLTKNVMTPMPYPPYSPDLVPSNFLCLFPWWKKSLNGNVLPM